MDSKNATKSSSHEQQQTAADQNSDPPPPYSDILLKPTTSQPQPMINHHLQPSSPPPPENLPQTYTSASRMLFTDLPDYHLNKLNFLGAVDQLLVKKKFLGCCKSGEKYTMKNSYGEKVMQTLEEPDGCCSCNRCCLTASGPIDMRIFDDRDNEIIHLITPNAYDCCFYFCKPKKLEVYIEGEQLIAIIEQDRTWSTRRFTIRNASGQALYQVQGSKLFSRSNNFKVISVYENIEVGFITNSLRKHAFKINFRLNLDTYMKVAIIGAAFFINFMVYKNLED